MAAVSGPLGHWVWADARSKDNKAKARSVSKAAHSHINAKMSMLVAIKGGGTRQTTKLLGRSEAAPGSQLRGYCVHAVGGESGKTLTPSRRESIRKLHNAKCGSGGRCSLHVSSWKAKLQAQFGVPMQALRRHPSVPRQALQQAAVVAAPVLAAPVAPAAPAETGPLTGRAAVQNMMSYVDENRERMTSGDLVRVSNVLQLTYNALPVARPVAQAQVPAAVA